MINQWLDKARWAPSGGNQQPWKVTAEINHSQAILYISINEQSKKENSPFTVGGTSHIYALGALAYYIELAAKTDGYQLVKTEKNDTQDPLQVVFKLTFTKTDSASDYPIEFFRKRRSNRNFYSSQKLSQEHSKLISHVMSHYSRLKLFSFLENRMEIVRALTPVEGIRWENIAFLNGMFKELNLNNENRATGLPANTLGVPYPTVLSLRVWKNNRWLDRLTRWGLKSFFTYVGFSILVKKSSGLFFIQATSNDLLDLFIAGKAMNHLWQELALQGLSFQMFGLTFIPYAYFHSNIINYTNIDVASIQNVRDEVMTKYGLDLKLPALCFRIGYCNIPTNETPRAPLQLS